MKAIANQKTFTVLVVLAMSTTVIVMLSSFTNNESSIAPRSLPSSLARFDNAGSSRKAAAINHSKCPLDKQFKIYFYNHHNPLHFRQYSIRKQQSILESLESSLKEKNMSASGPEEACAFLVVLHPLLQLDTSSIHNHLLSSLPYWNHHGLYGTNHIIVDLLEPTQERSSLFELSEVDIGRAMLVLSYMSDVVDILAPSLPQERSQRRNEMKSKSDQTTSVSSVYSTIDLLYADVNSSREYSSILPLNRKHLFYFEGTYVGSEHHHRREVGTLLSLIQKQASISSDGNNFMLSSNCKPSGLPAWDGEWRMCDRSERSRLLRCKESNFSLILGPLSPEDRPGPSTYRRLIESLKCGSIPVIFGLGKLPFDDVIDWNKAALIFPWSLWQDAMRIAVAMDTDLIMEFRKQGKFLLHTYFSTPRLVFDSILAVVRKKFLHPPPLAEDFSPALLKRAGRESEKAVKKDSPQYLNYALNTGEKIWNVPPGPHFVYPVTPFKPLSYHGRLEGRRMPLPNSIQSLRRTTSGKKMSTFLKMDRLSLLKQFANAPNMTEGGSHNSLKSRLQLESKSTTTKKRKLDGPASKYSYMDVTEQYTVVTLTHKRDEQIATLTASLEKCPFLHKIVIVWNNDYSIPEQMALPDASVPIEIVNTGQNSLNNRFLPLSNIETEAVLTLDDDIELTCDDIELGFRIWRENRDTLVGWTSRIHGRDPGGSWSYSFARVCERSMVITNAAFFHKYYAYLYSYWMPAEIREIVDLLMNCEDIAMNFLVSHITGKPFVKVGKKRAIQSSSNCKDDPQAGLSCDSSSHFLERDFCLNAFADYYGYVPLVYSVARTEPLSVALAGTLSQWCAKYDSL